MQKCFEQLKDIVKHNQARHFKGSFEILSALLNENPTNLLVKIYLGLTYLERGMATHNPEDLEKAKEVFSGVAEQQELQGLPITVHDIWETINWIEYSLVAQEKVSACQTMLLEKLEATEHADPNTDPLLN